jgi:hypothetical protein
MSIDDEILVRLSDGGLVPYRSFDDEPGKRTIYIGTWRVNDSPSVHDMLSGWVDGPEKRNRWLYAMQDFERFIHGEFVPVARNSRRAGTAQFERLEKPADEVWSLRCCLPKPGIRVLGRFAHKDVFVALTGHCREDLPDGDWPNEKAVCVRLWRNLLDDSYPFSGEFPYDYITGAVLSPGLVRRTHSP